jgi:hypothetical protein
MRTKKKKKKKKKKNERMKKNDLALRATASLLDQLDSEQEQHE